MGGADILVCLGAICQRAFAERTRMSAQDRQECLPHQEMLLRTDKNVCPTRRYCSGQTRMSAPPGDAAQDRQECLPNRNRAALRCSPAWGGGIVECEGYT